MAQTAAERLLDLSIRHKVGLANYESWVVSQVIGILDDADPDLENRISRAYERGASLDSITRLKNIRKELLAVNAEAYRAVGKTLTAEMVKLVNSEAEHAASDVEGVLPFKFSLTRPSRQQLRALVTENPFQGRLLGGISKDGVHSHIENIAGNRASELLRQIQMGVLQQESWSQILPRIRGTAAGKYRDGVLENVGRRQAETLARTAVMHYTEAARDELYAENEDLFSGTMWVATLDLRTCKLCSVRDGKVWNLERKPVGHSLTWEGGPGRLHFLDRCTGIGVFKSIDDLERLGIAPKNLKPAQRAAMEGPVPVTTDYEDWLRNQDLGTQEEVLGKGRAKEFRGGAKLEEVWDMRFDRVPAVAPSRAPVLPPPPEPVPAFASAAEASAWIEERYVTAVNLPAAKLEQMQTIASALHAVLDGRREEKLASIAWKSKGRRSLGTFSQGRQIIELQKTAASKRSNVADRVIHAWTVQHNEAIDRSTRYLALLKNPNPSIRGDLTSEIERTERKLAALRVNTRWATYQGSKNPLYDITAHEAGHALMWGAADDRVVEEFFNAALKKTTSFHSAVSEYAATKTTELWAEITALVASDRAAEVPVDLLEAWSDTVRFLELRLKTKKG